MKTNLYLIVLVLFLTTLCMGQQSTTVLLLGEKNPPQKPVEPGTESHQYYQDGQVIAKCLNTISGIKTHRFEQWPDKSQLPANIDVIVVLSYNAATSLYQPGNLDVFQQLMEKGVGLVAIHAGLFNRSNEIQHRPTMGYHLMNLGGIMSVQMQKSGLTQDTLKVQKIKPDHPICQGWKEYTLHDEFYIRPTLLRGAQSLLKVQIDFEGETVHNIVAWTYERRQQSQGRSFGFMLGHYHTLYGKKEHITLVLNGILWAAQKTPPQGGYNFQLTANDLEIE